LRNGIEMGDISIVDGDICMSRRKESPYRLFDAAKKKQEEVCG